MCSKCEELYSSKIALEIKYGQERSKFCSKILFPDHPHAEKRKQCGNLLMKSVVRSNGKKTFLYLLKVFCYTSVKQSIQKLLQQTDFSTNLFRNHHKIQNRDTYGNIYDRKVYKWFKDNTGRVYFPDKRNIKVMLNLD